MEQRIYHGDMTPSDLADGLLAHFNRGNLQTRIFGKNENKQVQIATSPGAQSGGETAITVTIGRVKDGVMVSVSEQAWLGVAASIGQTVISTIINPWNLLGRLDDLAQDVENMQIRDTVWQVIETIAKTKRASTQISERLQRLECLYCGTANPVGEGNCIACGAPLGNIQPQTCPSCGFIMLKGETNCPGCGKTFGK